MNSPNTKLEKALAVYLRANYLADLGNVAIYEGHRSDAKDAGDCISIVAGALAGPHANQGCYEVQVAFTVGTNARPQTTSALPPLAAHEGRVEALAGIFAESRASVVIAALALLDPELGVSGYWGYEREANLEGDNFATALGKTFACFLV